MKRNALFRIVLWGIVLLVLLVLLAMLFMGIYLPGISRRIQDNAPVTTPTEALIPVQETMVAAPETSAPTETSQYNAVVSADALNIRTMPSSEAPVAGMVEKGDQLLITRQELVNNVAWGYTPAPVNGWVQMEFVELLEPTDVEISTMETTASPEGEITGYGVALDAASIRNMEIEWAAGSIRIQPMEITEIRISEQGVDQDAHPMVWNVRNGQLNIQYSKNTDHSFGMGLLLGEHSKDLVIEVPLDWQCNSLEIDAASASLEVSDLTIREMEFDGASGTCIFENCTVEKLDVDTASGDVRFRCSLNQMECDAASANVVLELSNVPKSLEMDTASGDLDVVLPENAGFTVAMETMSGNFDSDFTTTQRNGNYDVYTIPVNGGADNDGCQSQRDGEGAKAHKIAEKSEYDHNRQKDGNPCHTADLVAGCCVGHIKFTSCCRSLIF